LASDEPSYRVKLDVYSGPMDLLLYLIRKNEVDIHDIPVGTITDQYMEFVDSMHVTDLDTAGEFLVMAATLLEIKARIMLPTETFGDDEDDPRNELVRQLMEYRAFKERAGQLTDMKSAMDQRFPRGIPFTDNRGRELDESSLKEVELWDLVSAFSKMLSQTSINMPSTLHEDDLPVSQYMARLMERLAESESEIAFEDAFIGARTRVQAIGIFLALLELAKQLRVRIFQHSLFGDIRIGISDEAPPGDFELPESERELMEAEINLAETPAETEGQEPSEPEPEEEPDWDDEDDDEPTAADVDIPDVDFLHEPEQSQEPEDEPLPQVEAETPEPQPEEQNAAPDEDTTEPDTPMENSPEEPRN